MALVGVLTSLSAALIRYGSSYIKNTENQLELQRGALLTLNWMIRDLSESSPVAIHTNPWGSLPEPPQPPLAGPPRGVVFASPRNANGQVTFAGSRIEWHSRICYLLDLADQGKIYRVVETHAPDPLPRVINPVVEDTNYFQSNLSVLPNRLLAKNVTYLDMQRQVDGVQIMLVATSPDQKFSVRVDTLVHPKN